MGKGLTAKQKEDQALADATYAKLQSDYGLTDAILNMDDTGSLSKAFEQIRAQKITDPTIAANILAGTAWFKSHGVQVTQNLSMEKTSPDVFKQNVATVKEQIRDEAARLGQTLSEADLTAISRDAFVYGKSFNSSQVINDIVTKGSGKAGGTYGDTVNSLKSYTASMGVNYSDNWYKTAGDKVAIGDMTVEDFQNQVKDMAKSKYQHFADQIDKGMTVSAIASPYIQSMSNLLEVPSSEIGLDDYNVNKALTSMTADGKQQAQPLWQFESELRKDPRWAKTKNARDAMDSTARSVLSSFGLVS
jgi:hypothetical protein